MPTNDMRSEAVPGGPFDDQLATRLLHQRIVVLGQEVDDPVANRVYAQLLLLSAGTRGKRFALPNARILMHQGSAGIRGTAVDIQIQAENLEYTKNLMTRLTAEHTGQDFETIAHDADRDRWFTAPAAVEYGLIAGVLESVADVRPAGDRQRIGLS